MTGGKRGAGSRARTLTIKQARINKRMTNQKNGRK